jgi:dihydroflavonol-4-reductase
VVLVTGGTGLLGSHLIYELLNQGETVRAIRRNQSHVLHVKEIFSYYTNKSEELFSKIEWIDGDVLDIYSILNAMEGIENVYHCAAIVSFFPKEREVMMKVNIEGTANVVNAALEQKIKKLCHVSSIAALGRTETSDVIDENTFWKQSPKNSRYSESKYYAENEVWRGIGEGLNAVIVNPSIILGPGFWHKGSTELLKTIHDGLTFYPSGNNGFVDVRDVARAMYALMKSDINSERFILSAENFSYKELCDICSHHFKVKKPSMKATKLMGEIYWRGIELINLFNGKDHLITKETIRTAFENYTYSNNKIKTTINFIFTPFDDTIQLLSNLYLNGLKKDKISG